MYGLVDCNNFFVSCERVFNPSLNNIPVVVLSNNDGCIIARSNEAKALGIKMGVPFFKAKNIIDKHNVKYCSTNFTLYSDMSDRVMTILSGLVPHMEVYSVDEAFLHLEGILSLEQYGRQIVDITSKSTGIPVSLGIAPTKTLAKIANYYAKKYPGYNRLCMIDSEEKRIKALKLLDIGEVWGIGRQFRKTLEYNSIKTAYDFTKRKRPWVRNKMSVIGERTWMELQGIPCFTKDEAVEKKQICTTRSFGYPITEFEPLMESIANFASLGTAKLRKQHASTKSITVFVHTSPYENKNYSGQYMPSKTIPLSYYTHDTGEIIHYCRMALNEMYRENYVYKRGGVILSDIVPNEFVMQDLFDPVDRIKQHRLLTACDRIALKNGRDVIKIASQGKGYLPHVRQKHLSKRYSTNLNEIITVNLK